MATDPYAAPRAHLADAALAASPDGTFTRAGRAVATGRGWSWIAEGWRLFKRQPGVWIGTVVVAFLLLMLLGLVPFVGNVVGTVLGPVIAAGLMTGCRALDSGGRMRFADLFAGFQRRFGALALTGLIYLGALIAIVVIAALLAGVGAGTMLQAWGGGEVEQGMSGARLALFGLLVMALVLPVAMAIWFVSPLLVFHEELGPLEAMKASFFGCVKNVLPFLLYGVVGMGLAIVATIPVALGWLLFGPTLAASIYTAYRDIFFVP
ncbi:MAG TPA: BPSS1780 family membrane protein [Burkholderiales bacterium]|nr:BPSS1780 family membrane protein [Burkholderiales bacterium]